MRNGGEVDTFGFAALPVRLKLARRALNFLTDSHDFLVKHVATAITLFFFLFFTEVALCDFHVSFS